MAWTYSSPDSGDRDKVRTYIGDTDSTDQLLSNEQIAYALSEGGTVKEAAAIAAEWIAALFARKSDTSVGDLSISYSQRAQQYRQLANGLRSRSARYALPYFGGISEAAKDTREADTDRVEPGFTVTMLDDETISSASDDADTDVS